MSSTSLLRRLAHISLSEHTVSIHNVFHSVMLQSAVMNALSSQCMTDLQSLSQIVSDEEFEIDKILRKSSYNEERI
jgi:hypothetical protein